MAIRSASTIEKPTMTGTPPPQYKGVVTARFTSQKFKTSAGGNPMIELEAEIVRPVSVVADLDGNTYDLTGQKLKYFVMLNEKDSKGQPSPNLFNFANKFCPMFELPTEFDDADPLKTHKFEGLCFEAIVSTNLRKEQKQNKDGSWSPLLDATGKEIDKGWQWSNQTSDILRKVETVEGKPF